MWGGEEEVAVEAVQDVSVWEAVNFKVAGSCQPCGSTG